MRTFTRLSLTVLTCSILAACGSSGSSSSHSSSSVNQENSGSGVVVAPKLNFPTGTGAAYVSKYSDKDVKESRVDLKDAGTEFLNVDGQSMRLDYSKGIGGLTIKTGTWLSDGVSSVCCGAYSDVRFGVLEGGPDDTSYVFYNGNPTTIMPTGKATYNGHALVTGNNAKFEDEDWLRGTAQFTADFANKKLDGTLLVNTLQPITINSEIKNNSFAGTAKSAEFHTIATVEGKFYGENAKELGGMFKNSSKAGDDTAWGGVFGASK